MANVSFLRGKQSALPARDKAQDGVFYLTTDTHRLYVGQGTELVDLNKYIKTVAKTTDLTTPTVDNLGDFYYVQEENLLVIAQQTAGDEANPEYGYVLINQNTDTKVESAAFVASATDKVATVTHTITEVGGKTIPSSFDIEAGTGLSISASEDGKKIIINGVTYGLDVVSVTVEGEEEGSTKKSSVAVQLKDSAGNAVGEALTLKPGQNIELHEDGNGNVTISSTYVDTHVTADSGSTMTWETDAEGAKTGKITMTIKHNDGSEVPVTLAEPIVYYIGENSYVPYSQLPVYSKEEIDNKLNGLDAMTYKGTLGASNGSVKALPTSGIKAGDTYLVVDAIIYDGSNTAYPGDMLIASGEEENGFIKEEEDEATGAMVAKVTWNYVPAGDDAKVDTTYKFSVDPATHTVNLVADQGGTFGTHTLQAVENGKIVLTSAYGGTEDEPDTKTLITTIEHAKITVVEPTPTKVADAKTFTHVTALTIDEWGHITGYDVNETTIVEYLLKGCTVTVESNTATITASLEAAGANAGSAAHTVGSTSLTIEAAGGAGYNINLVWGSFETPTA